MSTEKKYSNSVRKVNEPWSKTVQKVKDPWVEKD